jgi:hypothetical protein
VNWPGLTKNPPAPPMTTQAMITPPVAPPCVSVIAMREPPGVVYQDRALGSVLSVDLSTAFGGMIRFTASRRVVLSASRQPAVSISSMVPPEWKALAHTGWRAENHAQSLAAMARHHTGTSSTSVVLTPGYGLAAGSRRCYQGWECGRAGKRDDLQRRSPGRKGASQQ